MFESSSKHRYTLKFVFVEAKPNFIEKTTFYLIQWEYPDSVLVISENMARYAEKWGVNVPWRPQAIEQKIWLIYSSMQVLFNFLIREISKWVRDRYTKIIVTCTGYFNDCNGLHKTIGDSFIFIQRFKDMPHFSSNLHTTYVGMKQKCITTITCSIS